MLFFVCLHYYCYHYLAFCNKLLFQNIKIIDHNNRSVYCIPPYTPLLYSKNGVYRGKHIFLIFTLKHRLCVLVSFASNEGSDELGCPSIVIRAS